MKRTIGIVLGLGLVGGIGWYILNGDVEYVKPEVIVNHVEVEKEVFSKDIRIQNAQDAKRSEIETEAQTAYDETFNNAMTEVRAEVLKEMEAELKEERIEAEKKIGVY